MKSFSHLGIEVQFRQVTIPTYAPGPRDSNPPLFGRGVRSIYPYEWQKTFTTRIEEETYDAIVLSSSLMEITILPKWGMHLYKAVDRLTGRDLFFCPKVMKPAHNAIRGAYVAGGVEWNFPIGHSAATWSRVPLYLKKTDEGVQALFHHIERRSGTSIAAGITLVRDYRGVIFDQYMSNQTPLSQPWMCWINAGITPHETLRFAFPTEAMIGHYEGAFLETATRYRYPLMHGVDYSRYREIPEPIGLFSPCNVAGWFGVCYEDWRFGIVRWAPPWKVQGQKLWSWGNSEEGLLWGRIGADLALPVAEIQSGRPQTQMDRGVLRPYSTLSHREWWLPFSDMSNVQSASMYGAMDLEEDGADTCLRISPTIAVAGCCLRINQVATGRQFDLDPSKPCKVLLKMPKDRIEQIAVYSPDDTVFSWSKHYGPLAKSATCLYDSYEPTRAMSAEQLFLKGCYWQRMQKQDLARRCYRMALKRDPGFSRVHLHLGLLSILSDDYEGALRELSLALERDPQNDEALYFHGLASLWSGDTDQAFADFCVTAATGTSYVVPALVQLTLQSVRGGEHSRARMLVDYGLEREPANATFLFLRALDNRRRGNTRAWTVDCETLEEELGVSLQAQWEMYFAGKSNEHLHLRADNETEDADAINVALQYHEYGATEEAKQVLQRVTSETGSSQAFYLMKWMGYDVLGAPNVSFFAWGRQMRAALEFSLSSNTNDPVAGFGLGCLLAEIGQLDSAIASLSMASRLDPENSLFRTTLGTVHLERGNVEEAVKELRIAVSVSPPNPSAWVQLDRALELTGRRDNSWLSKFESASDEILENEEAREALARLSVDLEHYDFAEELLATMEFHPYELSHDVRNLWSRLHRKRAVQEALSGNYDEACSAVKKALEYPPNLHLGRPLRRSDSRTLYTAGVIMEAKGNVTDAESYFRLAAAEDQPDPVPTKPWSVLAQMKLEGDSEAAQRLHAITADALRYLEAGLQPDLEGDLKEIVALCQQIESGWRPSLQDLGAD
jgi:tetratricopeptide (TPR) repeat protein